MNILRVVGGFGGGLQNTLELLDSQLLDKYDVDKVGLMYLPQNLFSERDITLGGKRELIPLNVGNSDNLLLKYFNPKMLFKQSKIINDVLDKDYDLVHIHSPHLPHSALVSLVSKSKDVPVITTYHGARRESGAVWAGTKMISSVSEKLSSGSYAISKAAQEIYFGDSQVINNPISSAFNQNRGNNDVFNKLVCVARVCPDKGQLDLVNALSLITRSDFNCKLVGNLQDKKYVKLIRESIEKFNLEERIELTGEVNENTLKQIYSESSINILPTYQEGLGKVIIEAGLGEVPTIAYAVGGVPEIVEHGKNGLLSQKGDIGALSRNIEYLMSDGELQIEFGRNAKNKFIGNFESNVNASNYFNIYSSILN